jgi:hypothetical protein
MSLEAAAASARGGFACMFSTSEEFGWRSSPSVVRRALRSRRMRWPAILFVGCAAMVAGTVLLFA